jgi:hypothetical protein
LCRRTSEGGALAVAAGIRIADHLPAPDAHTSHGNRSSLLVMRSRIVPTLGGSVSNEMAVATTIGA